MSTFVDQVEEPAIATEAAALALVATQAVATGMVLARQLERTCFEACSRVTERDLGVLRYAAGEHISPELASSVEALHSATALREELEEALEDLLPWCGSVQVREACRVRQHENAQLH